MKKRIVKGKTVLKAVLCAAFMAPMMTSCYDDSKLWDEIEGIRNDIEALEQSLNEQVKALNDLVSKGNITVSACEKNTDGSYSITLSNGTSFKVLPEGADFSSLVTYKEVSGKKCWATYGANGETVAITDDAGRAIPIDNALEVKVVDGVYYLLINGQEYVTGYDASDVVQVFSSCTPLTDASGQTYAVRFTFGEGMEVTVTLDGYKGVIFRLNDVHTTLVSEYFINYGTTHTFLLDKDGVVDYVMQVPDGWRVKERTDELTAETYLDITAPSVEAVALGAAVADGDLKVVSVVDGGKAAVSRLYVSADPFRVYEVSALKAVIAPYAGLQKFMYGVMPYGDYSPATLIAKVNELLATTSDLPAGYCVAETAIDRTLEDIYGQEMSPESSYIFWVAPALYREGEDAGYYAVEDMLRTYSILSPVSAKMEVSDITVLDAQLKVSVSGTTSVYAGVSEITENYLEEIVYQINNGIIDPVTDRLTYEGPASAFPDSENPSILQPETGYVAWVVPVDIDKKSYLTSDIVYKEFTTNSIVSGGTIEVTVGEFTTTTSSLSAALTSEGAAMIYYSFLSESDGKRYQTASNETKMKYLMAGTGFTAVRAAEAVAQIGKLNPETAKWLYAAAVGHDGKYGDVICKSAETDKVSFNGIELEVSLVDVKSDNATLKVTATKGEPVEYIYWAGYSENSFWKSSDYCGGTRLNAQKYLAANPDADEVVAVMKRNGAIASDGTITVSDLNMNTDHIFVVLAKDASGLYSKCGYLKFTTLAADLGDVALEGSEKWNAAKEKISIEWIEDSFKLPENSNLSGSYSFRYSGPSDLTAYIMCGSTTYFEGAGLKTIPEQIVHVEEYASRRYDNGYVPFDDAGNMMNEPDYYKNGELRKGQLMNVYDYYVHGLPSLGFVTYFAKDSHGEGNCIYWDNGKDHYYERALERIAYYQTLEPYQLKAETFGLTGKEAEDWAQALLEAYRPYYENAVPLIYENDGSSILINNPYAIGVGDTGTVLDRLIIVLKDNEGNYYAPMSIEVPNYFK